LSFSIKGAYLRYHLFMAENTSAFDITCPCCSAVLKVDPTAKGVIAHTPAVKPKMFNDFEAAAKAMKEQDSRREYLPPVGGGAETCRRSSGKEISGSGQEGQRVSRHGKTHPRLRPRLTCFGKKYKRFTNFSLA